jgi:hypothetical protein
MPLEEQGKSSRENFEKLLENIRGSIKTLKGGLDSKREDLENLNEDFISKLSEQYCEQYSELNKEQLMLDENKKNLIDSTRGIIKNISYVYHQGIEFIINYKKELEYFLKELNRQKNLLYFILIFNLFICSYLLVENAHEIYLRSNGSIFQIFTSTISFSLKNTAVYQVLLAIFTYLISCKLLGLIKRNKEKNEEFQNRFLPLDSHLQKIECSLNSFNSLNYGDIEKNLLIKEKKIGEFSSIDSRKEKQYGIIKTIKTEIDKTIEVIASTYPWYEKIREMDAFEKKWDLECSKLTNISKYFNLNIDDDISLLKNDTDYSLMRDDTSVLENEIIDKICDKTQYDREIMEFLIKHYYNENTDLLWQKLKNSERYMLSTSSILYSSGQIKFDEDLTDEDIFCLILQKLPTFSFSSISSNIESYQRVYLYIENYMKKLETEGKIKFERQLTKKEVTDNISYDKVFELNFLSLFSKQLDLSTLFFENEPYKDALMAIVFNHDINFRSTVCQKAAKLDQTIYILMEYHELIQKKNKGNQFFVLNDLFECGFDFEEIEKEILNNPMKKRQHQFFKNELMRGEWYDTGQMLLKSMLEDITSKLQVEKKYETYIGVVKKSFENVNINTLDKAIDANLFTTYLILSSSYKGPLLTEIIDPLSCRINQYNSPDSPNVKDFESKYKISLFTQEGIKKYDFEKYSDSTRFGILHRDISFVDFVNGIKEDVNKIFNEKKSDKKWENVGFSVIRITPSKYSFGAMDDISDAQVKDMSISKFIARMAMGYTNDLEKTALTVLDKNVNLFKVIEQYSIFELVTLKMSDVGSYGKFLKQDKLKKAILVRLLDLYGIESFKDLGYLVKDDESFKKEIQQNLLEVFKSEYIIDSETTLVKTKKLELFVIALIGAAEDLALIYDI